MKNHHIFARLAAGAMSLGLLAHAAVCSAQTDRPSLLDSFRIGSGGGLLCQAQSRATDPLLTTLYDRAWTIVCRDSILPVGQVYALRLGDGATASQAIDRVAAARAGLACSAEGSATLSDIGAIRVRNCMGRDGLARAIGAVKRGRVVYVSDGFSAYQSALDLALRTAVTDRIAPGRVEAASLGGADNGAFARAQARALDPQAVLAEGYRRNNSGNYAEAAEFFDSLTDRLADPAGRSDERLTQAQRLNRAHEYGVNRALQMSNLGEFSAADALFRKLRSLPTADPVQLRLRRNFETMNFLNQGNVEAAIALIDQPVTAGEMLDDGASTTVDIGPRMAAELSSHQPSAMAMRQETRLTPEERAAILDAQAGQLRGTALRLSGRPEQARTALEKALADAIAIRNGRVTSITRLRAQLLGEIALTHEAQGHFGDAEALLRQGVALLAAQYPETVAMNGAKARLAAYLTRRGRTDEALGLYREVIASTAANRNALTGLTNQLGPYFTLLADGVSARPELAADLFAAMQVLVRPGSADTMESLTRSLSAGDGEAARLFRQSVSLSRDIERTRISLAQLTQAEARDASVKPLIAAAQADLDALTTQQAGTLASLAAYPQYRAVAKDTVSLADMQVVLKDGEAYFRLAQVGPALYGLWIDRSGATGYRLGISSGDLDTKVASLRDTISTSINGQQTTYPFDVAAARGLYLDLLAPVEQRLRTAHHLIFEPDGAMLALPLSVLVASQPGVDAYLARAADPKADGFDFRGVDWVGRTHVISTALSARAFRDARLASGSSASHRYIGFGENAPASAMRQVALTRSAVQPASTIDCRWPIAQWGSPISAAELRAAAHSLGEADSMVVTGQSFTDSALLTRTDLDQYHILHFATHGLVTAPRRDCPAEPALVTSFGPTPQSDGLLKFSEVFDLKLDADLVILSACDTAGKASAEATRSAGLSGGGSALDGLVRAFIGAGSRSVIASHWPAPDEFKATERIIGALFSASPGTSIGDALQTGQHVLMDEAATSHPFYWAGFSVIGDGARPVVSQH